MDTSEPLMEITESILYISSLLRDQPRRIDQVIDYFGDTSRGPEEPAKRTTAS